MRLVEVRESREATERDRLWVLALISLLGDDGLSMEDIEKITVRVNEIRDGKFKVNR